MKAQHSIVFIILILMAATLCPAQEKRDPRVIRDEITRLERINLKDKSASFREIHRNSLVRLYGEYGEALSQEIADLKTLQSTLSANDAASQKEITAQLQQLESEQRLNAEKMERLGGGQQALATVAANTTAQPATPAAVADSPQLTNATLTRVRTTTALAPATEPAGQDALSVSLDNIRSTDALRANQNAGAASDTKTVTVCGQIRPASLTQTFALIRSVEQGLSQTQAKAKTDAVNKSRYGDECQPDNALANGAQKDAVVDLLRTLLSELEQNKRAIKLNSRFSSLSLDTIRKQILLLNEYIGNVRIIIKDKDGNLAATPLTDKDGNYTAKLASGKTYYISTEADNQQTIREIAVGDADTRVNLPIEDRPVSLLTRAVVGYEQSGAASAKRDQDYFFDLFISSTFPFRQKINPDFGERFRTWIDLRFASVPQPGTATLGEFSTGFATQVSGLKVKDVANVFEFLGGFEYRLTGNNALLPSFDRQTKQKFSLSFIAGAGVTTPTNPQDSITTFKVFADAPGLPPIAAGKEFIAFVQSDRDRFFRQYYAGLRVQTFFFNLFNVPMQRFPAQLDLTIGQNEFVTGGRLRGPVIRIEGYYPLPYEQLKFINIFGTAMMRPGRSNITTPLILQPAPEGTVVPGANVALFALPQPNRDYYRAGVGLDFVSFIQKMKEAMTKK